MLAPSPRLSMNSFEIIRVVGEGTYGVVLKCRCKATGNIVAIKKFKEMNDDEYVQRVMLRELRVLNLLRGEPNVVQLIAAFREKGHLCLVMEYINGNLLDVIRQRPTGVPLPQLKQLLFTLLTGLRACHRNGIIHRDVKPENTLIRHGNISLLCDFGSSRTVQPPGGASLTTSGGLLQIPQGKCPQLTEYVATRWYRSPEMLMGNSNYSFASDMWAVGAIMAELAIGEPLLPGRSEIDQINLIRQRIGEFPPLLISNMESITPTQAIVLSYTTRGGRKTNNNNNNKSDYLTYRYRRVLGSDGLNLLQSLLTIDAAKRCTVEEALLHPFFDDVIIVDNESHPITNIEIIENISKTPTSIPRIRSMDQSPNDIRQERDKWFGVGEGKQVLLREIEPLRNAGLVEPQTPEVLAVDTLIIPPVTSNNNNSSNNSNININNISISISTNSNSSCDNSPIRNAKTKAAADQISLSKKQSPLINHYAEEHGTHHNIKPLPSNSIQLPTISSKSIFGVSGASPTAVSFPSMFPSPSLIRQPLKSISHSPERSQLTNQFSGFPPPRGPSNLISSNIDLHKEHNNSIYNTNSNNNNSNSIIRNNIFSVNGTSPIGLNTLQRPSLKKKGRLIFTSRMSVERL